MTSLVGRIRGARRAEQPIDLDGLVARTDALTRFLRAAEDHLPEARLVAARTMVERAGARLALSRDHTVVALAGATGSGKSSLFNALSRLTLSPVGVRRPTTAATFACVWGPLDGANKLLDWVGVLPRHRFVRESALDADDEAPLHGLVLLDLPDFDSVERSHRAEVDRLLSLVDLVIWVVDPQKYADKLVHTGYLAQFSRHRDVTVVVLNQADRLGDGDVERVLADLRGLLAVDGLDGVPVLASSATTPGAELELRSVLERTVAERQAFLRRLAGDVAGVVDDLAELIGPAVAEDAVDRTSTRMLGDALAAAAGVPAVAEATERAYRHRAAAVTGWPLVRWLRKFRPDPLRRLHLPNGGTGDASADVPVPVSSLPAPEASLRSGVALAVRVVAEQAARTLPEPWPAAVTTAARSRLDDLPDALDRCMASTDLGLRRTPTWWRLVGGLQWLCLLTAVGGLGWLVAGYVVRLLGLPPLDPPKLGAVPYPTLLFLGGLLLGLLVALITRPVVRWAARRARYRAQDRLRTGVVKVARDYVIAPVRQVLQEYAQARDALTAARGAD